MTPLIGQLIRDRNTGDWGEFLHWSGPTHLKNRRAVLRNPETGEKVYVRVPDMIVKRSPRATDYRGRLSEKARRIVAAATTAGTAGGG